MEIKIKDFNCNYIDCIKIVTIINLHFDLYLNFDYHHINYIDFIKTIIITNYNYYFNLCFTITNYYYTEHYLSNYYYNSYNHTYFAMMLVIM